MQDRPITGYILPWWAWVATSFYTGKTLTISMQHSGNMGQVGLVLLIAVLFVVALVLSPLAIIWALNTLFLLEIPYNFWTWLAVVVLLLLLGGSKVRARTPDQ